MAHDVFTDGEIEQQAHKCNEALDDLACMLKVNARHAIANDAAETAAADIARLTTVNVAIEAMRTTFKLTH